ncbi:MAG: hypothetical protein U0793_06875 [Gemmataceae bacterium]
MARDDSDEFEVVSEQRGPKPKVTALTMILIFLNMAAALGFLYLMSVNFQRRQAWAFATFQRDLDIQGLPLKEEDEGQSGSRAALPRMRLTGESLREAFKKRGGPMSRVPEAFADLDEPFTHSVEPRYLTDDILKAHFGPYTPPVRTLEDEMVRLKTDFLASIEKAAKDHVEAVKKVGSEEKRRDEVRRVVLPTAFTSRQLQAQKAKIDKASGDKLLEILEDGAQRRMLLEVLTPLETFRPGTLEKADDKFLITRAGDLEAYPLDELKRQFTKRMDAAVADKFDPEMFFGKEYAGTPRGSIEKRMAMGMVILSVAYTHRPDGKLLDADAIERAKKLLGLWEFAYSALNYTFCIGMLYSEPIVERGPDGKERIVAVGLLQQLHDAREGYTLITDPKTGEKRALPSSSFLARHEKLVQDIIDLQRELHIAKTRFKEMQDQNDIAEKAYDVRVKHLKETVEKLNASRARTAELAAKLRELQDQLFEAQVRLVEASEANFRLEAEIRAEQLRKKGKRP